VSGLGLGWVGYELLPGARPYEGDNRLAIALNIARKVVEPVTRLRDDVPTEVSDVIATAMMRDKTRRYATSAALADALEAAAGLAGGLARPDAIGRFVRAVQGDRIAKMESALSIASAGDDIAEISDEILRGLERSDQEQGLFEGSAPTIATYESNPRGGAPAAASSPPPPPVPAKQVDAEGATRAPRTELVMEGSAGNLQLDLASLRAPSRPQGLASAQPPPSPPELVAGPERTEAEVRATRARVVGALLGVLVVGIFGAWLGATRTFAILLLAAMVAGIVTLVMRSRSPSA